MINKRMLLALATLATVATIVLAIVLLRFPRSPQPWFWPDMGGELSAGRPSKAQLEQGAADQSAYVVLFLALFASALVAGLIWLTYAKRIGQTLVVGVPALLGHLSAASYLAWGSMWAIDSAVEDAGNLIGHAPEDTLHNSMSLASFFGWALFGFAAIAVIVSGAIRQPRSNASL